MRRAVKVGPGPQDPRHRDPGTREPPQSLKVGPRNPLQSLKVGPPLLALINSFFSEYFFAFLLIYFCFFFK